MIYIFIQRSQVMLPKEPEPAQPAEPRSAAPALAQPDVIPTNVVIQPPLTPQPEEVPPPAQFVNEDVVNVLPPHSTTATTTDIAEGIYANIQRQSEDANGVEANAATATDAIYQNQQDLADYIEDTGIRAVALYDYEAAAEDEISFDPDDIITHIEQVCSLSPISNPLIISISHSLSLLLRFIRLKTD